MIRFGYTILYVQNVKETLSFYQAAFGVVQKFLTPQNDYGELETGQTILAFASYALATRNGVDISHATHSQDSPPCEIAFVTDDVHALYAQAITAGAQRVATPSQKPWGQTVAYVRDMNGFLVEICTPMG